MEAGQYRSVTTMTKLRTSCESRQSPWRSSSMTLVLSCLLALPLIGRAQSGEQCAAVLPQVSDELDKTDPPMQYCFAQVRGVPVLWLYGGLGLNTFDNVSRGLRQTARYREVWLNSPGGYVHEGFKIGRELHRLKATVVVPNNGAQCVSACTMLMLGGYNRTVQSGATFQIHAKSSVMRLDLSRRVFNDLTWGDALTLSKQKKENLRALAEQHTRIEPQSSVQYAVYLQSVLEGTPNYALYEQLAIQPLPSPYAHSAPMPRNLDRDFAFLQAHDVVALQELMTQLELRGMRLMHERMLAQEAQLGRGSKVALRIFEANLACRIQDVCQLDRHQLESLGYHNFTRD